MADIEAKREAAMAKKEEDRKAKNAEISARKKQLAAERSKASAEKEAAAKEEEEKRASIDAKRNKNIADKEKGRTDKAAAESSRKNQSKYSRKDVWELKKVFDQYDKDKSGKISHYEWSQALQKHKADQAPKPGEKSTLEQRNTSKGLSIFDLGEGVFHEMDTDGDGDVTFPELLKLMFRCAPRAPP